MSTRVLYQEMIELPRAVRFPVELLPPDGFDEERPETWPEVHGRLEVVEGKLLFLPPSGDDQQYTVADVVVVLAAWRRQHPEFLLGTNEAGMRLGKATRAADAALWRRSDTGPRTGGLQRTPPVLAVEVVGRDDSEASLEDKVGWYLSHGVAVVWVVLPQSREVVVHTVKRSQRYRRGVSLPEHPMLPGLSPRVDALFEQIDVD